jgi:hypothetical protein
MSVDEGQSGFMSLITASTAGWSPWTAGCVPPAGLGLSGRPPGNGAMACLNC